MSKSFENKSCDSKSGGGCIYPRSMGTEEPIHPDTCGSWSEDKQKCDAEGENASKDAASTQIRHG